MSGQSAPFIQTYFHLLLTILLSQVVAAVVLAVVKVVEAAVVVIVQVLVAKTLAVVQVRSRRCHRRLELLLL